MLYFDLILKSNLLLNEFMYRRFNWSFQIPNEHRVIAELKTVAYQDPIYGREANCIVYTPQAIDMLKCLYHRTIKIDVISICKVAERTIKMYVNKLSSETNILRFLIIKSTSQMNIKNLFLNIFDHFLNQEPLNNHLLQLTHLIVKSYFIIRIHHFTMIESQP